MLTQFAYNQHLVQMTMFGGAKHGGTNDVTNVEGTNVVTEVAGANEVGEVENGCRGDSPRLMSRGQSPLG